MDWYQLVYSTSDDGGQTWSDPAVVPGTETMSNIITNAELNKTSIVDLAGNWHLFQTVADTSDTNWVNPETRLGDRGVRYIIDCIFDGTTWDIKEIARPQATHIFGDGLTRQLREHISTPAIDADGTIYYWYMDLVDTTGGYYYESYVKFSEDNGATWEGPVHVANNFNNLYDAADMARVASDHLHVIFDWYNTEGDTAVEHYYMAVPTAEIKNMVSVFNRPIDNTPNSYELYQNFPNPFNPTTTIHFDLKERAHVTLKIFNELGQEVETLLDKTIEAGFKGISWNATGYPSGVYFYQLKAGNYSETKKMVLAR